MKLDWTSATGANVRSPVPRIHDQASRRRADDGERPVRSEGAAKNPRSLHSHRMSMPIRRIEIDRMSAVRCSGVASK